MKRFHWNNRFEVSKKIHKKTKKKAKANLFPKLDIANRPSWFTKVVVGQCSSVAGLCNLILPYRAYAINIYFTLPLCNTNISYKIIQTSRLNNFHSKD